MTNDFIYLIGSLITFLNNINPNTPTKLLESNIRKEINLRIFYIKKYLKFYLKNF